jgi:hypothetical protein
MTTGEPYINPKSYTVFDEQTWSEVKGETVVDGTNDLINDGISIGNFL